MDILLISPKWNSAYRYINVVLPPLGLMYVASSLKDAGFSVRIVDENYEKVTENDLRECDVVGISTDTCRYPYALGIARMAKSAGKTVVMGGFHPTFMDREVLSTGLVDVVVRGEGEKAMVSVVEALKEGKDLAGIPGISYVRDGSFVRNPGMNIVDDVDSIPLPSRDIVNLERYPSSVLGERATTVASSRGCPFACSFCAVTKFSGRRWRARSAESIVDEVQEILEEKRARAIIFVDDNFTLDPKRVLRFCSLVKDRGLKFPWWCMSRVDTVVKNPEMVKEMAASGCSTIFLGIESGNQRSLEAHKKGISKSTSEEAVKILKKFGISPHGSFIICAPGETKEDVEETIRFSRELKLDVCQFSIMTPFPGTDLFEDLKGRIFDWDWLKYDGLHLVFHHENFTRKEAHRMLIKAYAGWFLSPRVIFNFASDIVHGRYKFVSGIKLVLKLIEAGIEGIFFSES